MIKNIKVKQKQVDDFNTIITYLAKRDVEQLEQKSLQDNYGIKKAELMILLGSSIIQSAEIAAEALRKGVAERLMIVGGIGHSTEYLINNIKSDNEYKNIHTQDRAEADILKDIIVNYHGVNEGDIIIENKSTNCGSNAQEAYKIVERMATKPKSVILVQDPTMQLRTYASFLHEWKEEGTCFINYAPLIPLLKLWKDKLAYVDENIGGLWDMDRLLTLLMGEIPRLHDNEMGYGPKGKGFIAHIDIPSEVLKAYERLLAVFDEIIKKR